jgi:hypothetical protein
MGKIPHKIGEGGGGFFDRPIRDLWISGIGLALGLIVALWLPVPLFLKIAAALLIGGLGLALGLGRDQGVWRFEERALQWLAHRRRPRRALWRKETPAAVPVAAAPPEEEPEPADLKLGKAPVGPPVDLGWGIVTAFVFSLLGGVTTWLATVGSQEIALWFRFVSGQ